MVEVSDLMCKSSSNLKSIGLKLGILEIRPSVDLLTFTSKSMGFLLYHFWCKTRSRKRPGWLSSEIRNAIKEKQKAFIRFKITGLELDLSFSGEKNRSIEGPLWAH